MQEVHNQKPNEKLTNHTEFVFARITSIGQAEAVQHQRLSLKEIIILHVNGYVLCFYFAKIPNKLMMIIQSINQADISLTLKP